MLEELPKFLLYPLITYHLSPPESWVRKQHDKESEPCTRTLRLPNRKPNLPATTLNTTSPVQISIQIKLGSKEVKSRLDLSWDFLNALESELEQT